MKRFAVKRTEPREGNELFNPINYVALDTEKWRTLKRNPKYAVSTHGRVKVIKPYKNSVPVGYILNQRVDKYGYAVVDLYCNQKQTRPRVHKLVAETFLGPCPKGKEVRHKDGTRTNSNVSNLCYGTRSDNMQDAIKHGTHHGPLGHRHTPEAIEKIREAAKQMWARRKENVSQKSKNSKHGK